MEQRKAGSLRAGGGGPRPRAQRLQLAVLLTDHPPEDSVRLVAATEEPATKFRFQPVHYYEQRCALLGLVAPPEGERLPALPGFAVQRGRRGGKPAEWLHLLGRARPGFRAGSKVQSTGLYKAIDRALADIHPGPDPNWFDWWLAVEFAWRGYASERKAEARAAAAGLAVAVATERITRSGGLLVWHEYMERCCRQLRYELIHGKRNPLLAVMTAALVRGRLDLMDNALAAVILEFFAQSEGMQHVPDDDGGQVGLAGELAPPELAAVDERAVTKVMEALAAGQAAGRGGLAKLVPSQPHVVAWLFEAGRLVEAPDGYLFTAEEVLDYRRQLLAGGLDPAQAGVGDLKARLGLGRKAAEGLRSLLVATSG